MITSQLSHTGQGEFPFLPKPEPTASRTSTPGSILRGPGLELLGGPRKKREGCPTLSEASFLGGLGALEVGYGPVSLGRSGWLQGRRGVQAKTWP